MKIMAFGTFGFFLCVLLLITHILCDEFCIQRCSCETVASKVKLQCGGKDQPIKLIDEIDFGSLAPNIIKLNLSSNEISNISKFVPLPSLRKLDLSKNRISYIEHGVFIYTPELKQIDLSNNLLSTLKQSIFDHLVLLKQIDISNNPLICDCDIIFVAEYLQNKSVKLLANPKCTYPKSRKVQYLKKIKPGNLHECNLPTENEETTIRIRPTEDQIVFEGDSLNLNCLASGIPPSYTETTKDEVYSANISWFNSNNIHNQFNDSVIVNKYSSFGGIIDSSLHISKLNRNHTGTWNCEFISQNLNQTKTILVIVISNDTKYCPSTITTNNKGIYPWPKTIIGYSIDLPCEGNPLDHTMRAYYKCSKPGIWSNLNTTTCPYISEITRILEQFSKVNLTLTKVNVYESALHLKKNYTSDPKLIKDKMDIVFISRTVQNYLEFLWNDKDLGRVLADIINNMLILPKTFLQQANLEDNSSSKFINSLEVVAEYLTAINRPYFSTQEFRLKKDSFPGLSCTWFTDTKREQPKIQCTHSDDSWQTMDGDKTMEAKIQIPDLSFLQMQHDGLITSIRLFMALYTNNKFFPVDFENSTDSFVSVVGSKLENIMIENLTTPISIIMRLNDYQDETNPLPVRWDPSLNKGHGGWTSSGCQVTHLFQDLLVFECNQFGYYTVLQKRTSNKVSLPLGAKFRLAHPAIYIGGFVLFTSLLTSIVTYLLCYSSIQMAKKAKHSIINTWIAVSLLCFMFTFGIYQTEDLKVCQSVGIIIHYLTLSSLLWMCVTVSNMYKRISKSENTVLTDEGLELDQPVQKPILGLYLVGWGIALIVCGISGAVNMRDYASHSYCFLGSIPALSAIIVPVIILLIFIIVFLLMIRCNLRTTEAVTQLSEGTQGTENVDLDLLEPNLPTSATGSVKSSSTRSSMIEDSEHGPMTQLRAHLINLIIFTVAWSFAGMATSMPLKQFFFYEEDLFGIIYSLFASAFGMFNLFFYCVARNDVRVEWSTARRWLKKKQFCFRTRSVSDTNRSLPPLNTNQMSVETQMTSRSSSRSSKSVSRQSNNLKGAADLNSAHVDQENKSTNVDLVVLHRQQYRTNNTIPVYELASMNGAEMFYNPHQSGVARKFFRKQRRHMMKHNNLGPRRRDTGSINSVKTNKSNSDVSSNIFGTSSKVNNTNIHVEQVKENKQKNLNILSDISDSELSSRLDIPVHQLMLNAKKNRLQMSRKPKINTQHIEIALESNHEKDMRTVSQQCSLEYSSETLSERVLDKDLDMDASVACSDFTDFNKVDKDPLGQIYVNPMDDLDFSDRKSRGCSLRSSMSASDVDELYAQIRPGNNCPRSRTLATLCADFDSAEVNHFNLEELEKSETTV